MSNSVVLLVGSYIILGVQAACRESFRVFTFRTCFTVQPAGRATYCQGKARYSWIICRKISPYKLLRRPVQEVCLGSHGGRLVSFIVQYTSYIPVSCLYCTTRSVNIEGDFYTYMRACNIVLERTKLLHRTKTVHNDNV